jgi:hypothetical protein
LPKKPHLAFLRENIVQKLGIKRSRIYARAKELAIQAQTKTEDGIYLLAAQSGINLNKFLPSEKVRQIRELLFQIKQPAEAIQLREDKIKKKLAIKNVTINICKNVSLKNLLLSDKILKEAKDMAEKVYPVLYVFENSARQMIVRVMRHAYGDNWWDIDTKVSTDIRNKVRDRMVNEDKNPWHGRRGAHPIYYTDLEHLGQIVKNNWHLFKQILPTQEWFLQRVKEVGHSRNPVAHMNPLTKEDIERIKVYTRDWEKLIDQKIGVIP